MSHMSPRAYGKLSAKMLCLWGLVFAYHQTHQGHYECPPPPHALKAYNHKVNYYSHKDLSAVECSILQYARVLQYISYKSDDRYYWEIMLTVKCFRVRVILPFENQWLNALPDDEFLQTNMMPNCNCPAPDYGVKNHIAMICVPFFKDIESQDDYERMWE